jgi:mutator protein MutT
MTRQRSAAILIENDQIALIERHRRDRHYFVFPGGGLEEGETPEQALLREVEEELGVCVSIQQLVVEVWYHGVPQSYYLVRTTSGEFGKGRGEEYTQPQPPEVGTYHPMWMPVSKILDEPVLPSQVAEIVQKCYPASWPRRPIYIHNPRDD